MDLYTQTSLFGDGGMSPPQQASTPDLPSIRQRLAHLLQTLQAAERDMPLPERELRMWRTVVPNMTKWLPEEEAQHIRSTFTRELQRLTAGSDIP